MTVIQSFEPAVIYLKVRGEDEMARSKTIVFILSDGTLKTNILQIQSIPMHNTINKYLH